MVFISVVCACPIRCSSSRIARPSIINVLPLPAESHDAFEPRGEFKIKRHNRPLNGRDAVQTLCAMRCHTGQKSRASADPSSVCESLAKCFRVLPFLSCTVQIPFVIASIRS